MYTCSLGSTGLKKLEKIQTLFKKAVRKNILKWSPVEDGGEITVYFVNLTQKITFMMEY